MVIKQQKPILPGSVIGIVGSGQLGRMLGLVAKRMGYRLACFSPDKVSPLGQIADYEFVAAYDDFAELEKFAKISDVVTYEFENINYESLKFLEDKVCVRPNSKVLHTFQNRLREKTFLSENALPTALFRHIKSRQDLNVAIKDIKLPAVLKTAGFGYDGKGQYKLLTEQDAENLDDTIFSQEFILEEFVTFEAEASIIGARSEQGEICTFPLIRNIHRNHILDISAFPAGFSEQLENDAKNIFAKIAETLQVVGLICVEFFVTNAGKLLVNEVAPRTHNSGHLTIEAFNISQFELQLRSVCGLPLGNLEPVFQSAAMLNILGDIWKDGEPDFAKLFNNPAFHLHLYGKLEAKPGRKMGHLTIAGTEEAGTAGSIQNVLSLVQNAKQILRINS